MELFTLIEKHPLSSLAALLLAAWIGYRFALSRDTVNSRKEVGKRIADAFRPELDSLIQINGNAGLVLTDEAFKKHEAAVRNNVRLLSWTARFRLWRAWHELAFHPEDKTHKLPFYAQYFDGGSLDKRAVVRPLAIQRLQRIISIVG